MADQSEQHLLDISTKIQQMVDLLRAQQASPQGGSPTTGGPGTVMSGPDGPPDYVQMMMNNQAARAEKPREIVEKADPVSIMGFAPKSLQNLAKAVRGEEKDVEYKQTKAGDSFIDGLLKSIGTPLLALAGGVTALLASANIDFGAFEGLANAIGKGGLQAGLKMFTKAFGKLAGPILRKIPVVGALISFYYAKERFDKGDTIGMAIDIASGIANLLNLVMPGVGSMLSIGLDMLNAYLDYKTDGAADVKAAKTDILKEMGKKAWNAIGPYIRFIPFVGSFWLAKDAYDAFKGGDWGNAFLYTVRTIANFVPLAGTAVNIGLSVVQGLFDPSKREKNAITDGAMSLIEQFGPTFQTYIEPFIRDIPFVGSFFHAYDMIEAFKGGKWISGSLSLLQTVAGFVPGFGLLLTPALSFIRGMFDPSYKGKSKLGDAGGSLMEMAIGWGEQLVTWMNPWVRDVPFLGSFFYFGDAVKSFNKGSWGKGTTEVIQGMIALVPGFGQLLNPAINFIRGLFGDTKMAKKSAVASAGKSVGDWVGNMAETAKNKLSEMIWSLVDDYVPNVWGIKDGVVALLDKMGIKKPSGVKIAKDVTMPKRSSRGPTRDPAELTDAVSSGPRKRTKRFNSKERDRLAAIAEEEEIKIRNIAAQKKRMSQVQELQKNDDFNKTVNNLRATQQNATNTTIGGANTAMNAMNSANAQILAAIKENNQHLAQLTAEIPKAVRETGTTVNNNNSNVNSSTVNNQSGGQTTSSLRESVRMKYYR